MHAPANRHSMTLALALAPIMNENFGLGLNSPSMPDIVRQEMATPLKTVSNDNAVV